MIRPSYVLSDCCYAAVYLINLFKIDKTNKTLEFPEIDLDQFKASFGLVLKDRIIFMDTRNLNHPGELLNLC